MAVRRGPRCPQRLWRCAGLRGPYRARAPSRKTKFERFWTRSSARAERGAHADHLLQSCSCQEIVVSGWPQRNIQDATIVQADVVWVPQEQIRKVRRNCRLDPL